MQQEHRHMACHTTPRLDALKTILCRVRTVADIGCDHAYLPILLAQQGSVQKIIATDVRPGPLAKAQENITRFGFSNAIETRLGNGLTPLAPGETEAIVIAGMGAAVICSILQAGEAVARCAKLLVLQPMSAAPELRHFLYQNNYTIIKEVLVQEDARIYTIILAQNGKEPTFSMLDCYISRSLRQEQPPLYTAYVQKLAVQLRTAAAGMRKAQREHKQLKDYEALLRELEQTISI